jgi:O-antigen ligase
MDSNLTPGSADALGRRPRLRQRGIAFVSAAQEALVLTLVCLSPWVYGAVDPFPQFLLFAGVAGLLTLWGARMLLEGCLTWQKCPVLVCLAALFALGVLQLIALPRNLLDGLAPATAEMYDRLLPSQPEILPFGEGREAPAPPAGSTLSLYPAGTRAQALQLLAVVLLFAAVRNNIASAHALLRFCFVALGNGALLALFGLVQFFSAPHHVLYWSEPTTGQPFGPFVNRNHFAFYINLCIGLGLGLLLSRYAPSSGPPPVASGRREFQTGAGPGPRLGLLQDSPALWISVALALMLSSVAVCLSRGGILALVGASAVCLAAWLAMSRQFLRLGAVVLVGALATFLVAWVGLARIESRWATVWEGEALDNRLPVWSRSLPLARDFFVWGTGYGTFVHVEPTQRQTADEVKVVYDFAHNEYLEALIEGGLVRLLLSLCAIGLVFWLGYRALRRHQGYPAGGLALGALFGFTAMVLHSAGEFGLHIPAIALLATVLCAQLCALGQTDAAGHQAAPYTLRLGGMAPVVGAATALALGLVLAAEGWRAEQAARLRLAAFPPAESRERVGAHEQIALMESAVRLYPESAYLQAELAQLYLNQFESEQERLARGGQLTDAVEVLATLATAGMCPSALDPALAGVTSWQARRSAREMLARGTKARLSRAYLLPALRHFVVARDLCPLLAEPHVRIGVLANYFGRAEPSSVYLNRARWLVPFDPELWYLCGARDLEDGRPEEAWPTWRRSLELSDRYLPEILARAGKYLRPPEILARILPDRPGQLLRAATTLYPAPEDGDERRPFLEKALTVLARQPALSAEEYEEKARAHTALEQPDAALMAYRAALDRRPEAGDWRLAYARLLFKQGRLQEARREVRTVLDLRPQDAPARELLEEVSRDIARGRIPDRKE